MSYSAVLSVIVGEFVPCFLFTGTDTMDVVWLVSVFYIHVLKYLISLFSNKDYFKIISAFG